MRAVTNRIKGVLVLLLLLAGLPLIGVLPHQLGAIRMGGLSLLWWYGGIVAPLAAWLVAVAWLSDSRPGPSSGPE